MKIANAYPPNYDAICAVFAIRGNRDVVFTYGDTLYVPGGGQPSDHLLVHEQTHQVQQKEFGPAEWWERYLTDGGFRLVQEVEAYRKQWAFLYSSRSRKVRRMVLRKLAEDLAGPMYGHIVEVEQAKKLIQGVSTS